MTQAVIITDRHAASDHGVAALQQAVRRDCSIALYTPDTLPPQLPPDAIVCPLTLNLPIDLRFPGQAVYQACQDLAGLRDRVQPYAAVGTGFFWLPIVLTAKGALYAESISHRNPCSIPPSATLGYRQPLHLTDRQRQPLYALAQKLLHSLAAPPAVYLLQFGFHEDQILFDRLIPFPDTPSIASLNVQTPNLYECHWRCLTQQAITDLQIEGAIGYETLE